MTKDEKLLNLARLGGTDKDLIFFDDLNYLEEKVNSIKEEVDKELSALDKKIDEKTEKTQEILEAVSKKESTVIQLEADGETTTLQGEKGDTGPEPSDERLQELIKPLIPEPIAGEDGLDGQDSTVAGPQGERGEMGPAGKDGVDGRNGIDGKDGVDGLDGKDGSPDTAEQVRDKLEGLKDGEKLSIQAIQDLAKILDEIRVKPVKGGGGFSKIHMDRHFIDDETPSGSGTSFTISKAPNPISSFKLYRGGSLQRAGEDYTLSGRNLTLNIALQVGEILLCDFRY